MDQALDARAEEAIRAALTGSDRDAPAQVLDRGFGSLAVRFGGTVARIAATAEVGDAYGREVVTLPVLAGRLPVAVPAPARPVPAGAGLPYGALLHPWLAGDVMTEDDAVLHPGLGDEIAACLAALHGVEPAAFPAGSLPHVEPVSRLRDLLVQTEAWLSGRLTPPQRGRLTDLAERATHVLPGRAPVVCHADPWFGNMLIEDGHLTALLDVEGLCLADPAFDLAALTYLTPPSNDRTIAAYIDMTGPLEDLDGRMQGYLLILELGGLAYGLRNDLPDEAEHSFGGVLDLVR